jgi:hypothetical protein
MDQKSDVEHQLGSSEAAYKREYRKLGDLYDPGRNALGAYASELGLGAAPKGYSGISMSPATQFLLTQGRKEAEGGAAGSGGLYSGNTLVELERMRQGYAAQDRDNQLSQLYGLGTYATEGLAGREQQLANRRIGAVQDFVGNMANARGQRANLYGTAATNYTQGASNALANYGNAAASGAIGVGNAITGGINNALGTYGYMQQTRNGTENLNQGSGWPLSQPPRPRQ